MTKRTSALTLSAMFIALGILTPVLFHSVGLGSVLLPMFWPIAAAAFFLPLPFAIAVGVLTPVFSLFITGMPPVSPPILQIMVIELFTLSLVTNFLYKNFKVGIFFPLLTGLLASRIVLFILVKPLASWLGLPPGIASVAYVLKGAPGILIMLIVVPIIVNRIKNEPLFRSR